MALQITTEQEEFGSKPYSAAYSPGESVHILNTDEV